jgi:hypothetical protein
MMDIQVSENLFLLFVQLDCFAFISDAFFRAFLCSQLGVFQHHFFNLQMKSMNIFILRFPSLHKSFQSLLSHLLLQQHHDSQCFFIYKQQLSDQKPQPLHNIHVILSKACYCARRSSYSTQSQSRLSYRIFRQLADVPVTRQERKLWQLRCCLLNTTIQLIMQQKTSSGSTARRDNWN